MNREELKSVFGPDELKEILKRLYVLEKKSCEQISSYFKQKYDIVATHNVVHLLLDEFGIPVRGISESVSLATRTLDYDENILQEGSLILEAFNGVLISDATISNYKDQTYHRLSMSSSQREFIEYSRSFFTKLSPSEISSKKCVREDGSRGYEKEMFGFATATHPDITKQRIKWYDGSSKKIPRDIKITPLMLKLWYYGDGSIVTKREKFNTCILRLSTDGFSDDDIDFLVEQLRVQVGLSSQKAEKRIRIKSASVPSFFRYIGRKSDLTCYSYKFDVDEWRFWTGMKEASKILGIPYNRLNHLVGIKCIDFNRSPGGKKVCFTDEQMEKLKSLNKNNLLMVDPRRNSAAITKNSFRKAPKNIEEKFKEVKKMGFPHVSLSEVEKIITFNRLNNVPSLSIKNDKEIIATARDNDLAINYHPHLFSVTSGNCRSPEEAFRDDKNLLNIVSKLSNKNAELSDKNIRYEICRSKNTKRTSVFPVRVAKTIYTSFGKDNMKVLDPCAGYSSRLIGFYGCARGGEYLGIDPCLKTYNGLQETKKYIEPMTTKHKAVICNGMAEEVMPQLNDKFDVIFTSPPYFNLERYSDEPTQSFVKYPTYEQWLEKFLFKIIDESFRLLKDDGCFVLNISNVDDKQLIDHVDLYVKRKFRIENVLLMVFPSMFQEYFTEPIFILRKN